MTGKITKAVSAAILLSALLLPTLPANAAKAVFCSNTGARFNEWKAVIKSKYKKRFKKSTLAKLDKVKYSPKVIKLDRGNKKHFRGSFAKFYQRRSRGVTPRARKKIKQYKKYFVRAEKQFGVPPEIIAAVWALESAFGRYKGNLPILQSIATLAYDCRRSKALFFPELIAALTILDKGKLNLLTERGAWAGEHGQTQFLATRILNASVDYDGKGVNLSTSAPDVIGSTAKWFAISGWKRGGSYAKGTANYQVITKWNHAKLYQRTIAKLAKEIKG